MKRITITARGPNKVEEVCSVCGSKRCKYFLAKEKCLSKKYQKEGLTKRERGNRIVFRF